MSARPQANPASPPPPDGLALVMSGGGARAAYQVGLLRCLARRAPGLRIPIVTGVSAGAINAAALAALPGAFPERVGRLSDFWSRLQPGDVFGVGGLHLFRNALRWWLRLMSGGRLGHATPRQGLLDTDPLERLLRTALGAPDGRLSGIAENLDSGRIRSVAVSATSYTTGQSVTWIQGRQIEGWERPLRRGARADLEVAHVLASSALPLLFPAVKVGPEWFGDGGVRLAAPLSPAVHLGAERILAISTRYSRSRTEADQPAVAGYPPAAQVAGVLLNAIFLDLLDFDAQRLERINGLVATLPEERRQGLRPIRLLVLRPSQDLGRLADEYEVQLPRGMRFMTRGLGTRETRSNDLLSLLMFQPEYLQRLIALGEEDADARFGEIAAFLDGG